MLPTSPQIVLHVHFIRSPGKAGAEGREGRAEAERGSSRSAPEEATRASSSPTEASSARRSAAADWPVPEAGGDGFTGRSSESLSSVEDDKVTSDSSCSAASKRDLVTDGTLFSIV